MNLLPCVIGHASLSCWSRHARFDAPLCPPLIRLLLHFQPLETETHGWGWSLHSCTVIQILPALGTEFRMLISEEEAEFGLLHKA
jgi:hypothetical protein